jgi:1,4-dihydroxy-2-naphthoate polyprenyltransferase
VRLAYRGLGELATMAAVGFLMPAIGDFSQFGVAFSPLFMICLVPLLLYSLSFIVNVEMPDMEGDIAGGKRNFVARKGRAAGFMVIGLLCILATMFLAALCFGHYQIDFRPVLLFSSVPLLPALFGLIKRPANRDVAVKLVQINVGCFLLFILLMDAYLVFIHL